MKIMYWGGGGEGGGGGGGTKEGWGESQSISRRAVQNATKHHTTNGRLPRNVELYIWCTIDFKLTEVELVFRSKAMLILYMLVHRSILRYIEVYHNSEGGVKWGHVPQCHLRWRERPFSSTPLRSLEDKTQLKIAIYKSLQFMSLVTFTEKQHKIRNLGK